MEDLEASLLEYETVGEFLTEIKKEFGRENEKIVKVAKLKRLEQGRRAMKEFVQEFRRATRESGYKEQLLIKEFKRDMNGTIY